MTPRNRFIGALEHRPLTGLVPHFELAFFLTMEAFGKVHPLHRSYHQWLQMTDHERDLHRRDIADLHIAIADRYEHSAILLQPNPNTTEETRRLLDLIRDKTGDRFFLMVHGDATFSLPDGAQMESFCYRLADEPDKVHAEAAANLDWTIRHIEKLRHHGGLDGVAMCCDYCFNTGPFLSPALFSEFIAPYLAQQIAAYRNLGLYTIKHTDGNILPILDQLAQTNPHALHSLDPQGGVDITDIKRRFGDKLCLIGNVNCGLMDTGTDEDVIASARYALRHGMPGGGYIFSTSNCIYTGMRLARYELILNLWRREGHYPLN